jgi:hypothetical protein
MLLWAMGITCVKFTILAFYWRLFPPKRFRQVVLATGIFISLSAISFIFTFIFQCTPISHFWNKTDGGFCVNRTQFYIVSGGINIATDVFILLLPMPLLWKLKTSTSQKIGLTMIFLLGGL